jgi:hypothetical protein
MGWGGIAPPFLTSTLDGSEWLASRPGSFSAAYPVDRRVGETQPGWTTWRRDKSLSSARNQTAVFQLVARRYTDSILHAFVNLLHILGLQTWVLQYVFFFIFFFNGSSSPFRALASYSVP